jgi:hypothetical protein
MTLITFIFASPRIIVVLIPPLCISFLIFGSRTAGPGASRLNHALVCLRLQVTGLLPLMTSLERPTCIVSHLLSPSDQTAKPSTAVQMARTTPWNQIYCSRRTTRISRVFGVSRTSLFMSRMDSTTTLSPHIGCQVTNSSMEDPRPVLMAKILLLRTEATPNRALDALLQFPTTSHSLSTLIRLGPSPPRITLLEMFLAEADVPSCE